MRALATLVLYLLAIPVIWAAPAHYTLDPVHTRVVLAVSHAGFSQAIATVSGSQGSLQFDPEDWRSAKLDVRVPLQRMDFGDADWNKAVLAPRLLNVERYPEARFVSSRVEPIDAQRARVFGTLSLHGQDKEIALEVTLNALKRHPLPPFRRTAGFSASATLRRSDFGIDAWKSMIGDEVQLRIEVEAIRGGSSAPDAAESDANPTPPTEIQDKDQP